jgi:hypothetical protein
MRLMLFSDRGGRPTTYTDFMKIAPGSTVTHVHESPTERLTLGSVTVAAAEPVRAVLAPVPGDPPGAIRRIVAGAQITRTQSAGADGSHVLGDPIVVPLERCNFEPRGFVPHTGMQWHWNCAPDMFPLDNAWRTPGL